MNHCCSILTLQELPSRAAPHVLQEVQEPSHVLLAMGRDKATAKASIRFSMGNSTTEEDIDYTFNELEKIVSRIGTIL